MQAHGEKCDILELGWKSLKEENHQIRWSANVCLTVAMIVFVISSATRNYSQVDKIWSIMPVVYCWIVVTDSRTLIMAIVATVWGVRLTWNFYRRGGYKWPPWDGDEDYRWKYIQDGFHLSILKNSVVWTLFNFGFISGYQNILLWLIVSPAMVVHIIAASPDCDSSPLNAYDLIAVNLFLMMVFVESIADNQQYAFQTEKHRLMSEKKLLVGDYADGFCKSGLFSILRKPNYAAEQALWASFYIFSFAAFQGRRWWNPSAIGCALLVQLFSASGPFTEKISMSKYPKYKDYKNEVPLYWPNPFRLFGMKKKKTHRS